VLVLQLACIITLASPFAVRSFLYRQFYPLVTVSAAQLQAPPETLRPLGFRMDAPADLEAFRTIAAPVVESAESDGERLRRLGDWIYSRRQTGKPLISGGREQGVLALLHRLQDGEQGLCGHMTLVIAGLWRSLGRDFREIRFTASDTKAWYAAHYGIEVYAPESGRWVYYDVGLNGYAVGAAGELLSLSDINQRLADGQTVSIVASTQHQDWNAETFLDFLRQHQRQVISLNNQLRGLDPDRRFGPLHFAYPLLSRLPKPFDRVVDALTGDSAPRMVLSTPPPPPAPGARLRVISPSPRD
jgi:hypothetical protein